jgi:transcriptional regulator of acetoin/glycerol metabolism
MLEGHVASAVMNRLGPGAEHPSQVRPIESAPASGRLILTPEDVYDSWRRCMAEYHVDPRSRTAPNVITQSELKVSSEPHADLIVHAREEIDRLYAIVRQQGYVVLLCNEEGVAIHHRGDEARARVGLHYKDFFAGHATLPEDSY